MRLLFFRTQHFRRPLPCPRVWQHPVGLATMPIGVTGYTLLVGASGFAVPALKNALLKHPLMYRASRSAPAPRHARTRALPRWP